MCFLWNQDCKSTWFVSLFNRMYISISVFLSVIETLFFRLHPQSGVVDFTPAASGAALPLCAHSSSALCWTPALQVCTYSTPCTLVLKCWHVTLKWKFPQKWKLSLTWPQVIPNLYEFLCYAEHKGRYFEESLYPGCFGTPLTSIVGKKIRWKSMVPQNCSVSHILQNIFLCVQQNKDIHTGLEQLEGE